MAPETQLERREEDTVETVVGPSMNVEGDFVSEGNVVVKGTVAGSVKTNKSLTIEQGAKVIASVRAANVVVSGQVKGNIRAKEKLEITSSAQILGDMQCSVLMIEAGALIQGKVEMAGIQIDVPKGERKSNSLRSKIARVGKPDEESVSSEQITEMI
ncbi:MAG: hypothetical protein A3G08_01720 [Candidatus Magasanikbacteria bacterium RIFCSPLOWO2_12_FULL_47_9b]|nr:MAG: hypothetical protein A3I74_05175 [Candidatus Magasanikbacteria bacterium RIFCSPLOWO2_02_FULL_47_16]OGH79407.1 MAG: hypothetical protein A3C10_05010 [Candidatus Magasanikbacteria bacterium RIFCSPHIGHO2_02_FULL_48_18]OGH83098.1 MAG: hypothetical protein A3G08_01720 [Candidatus Magasanikbacteria bacterium RIFCSPLOWO2_12_FULL_47_9b]